MDTFLHIHLTFSTWEKLEEESYSGLEFKNKCIAQMLSIPLDTRIYKRGIMERFMVRQLGKDFPQIGKRKSKSINYGTSENPYKR